MATSTLAKIADYDVTKGSLADVARTSGRSLAETFVSADVVVIVDVSGSMATNDSRGGRERYQVALEELANLQASLRGRVAVIAFSDVPLFVPGGQPPFLAGGTDLAGALKFARVADTPGVRFFVISDGLPVDGRAALAEAAQFQARVDTVFVGDERDHAARSFMLRLATQQGGQTMTAARVNELANTVQYLLTA